MTSQQSSATQTKYRVIKTQRQPVRHFLPTLDREIIHVATEVRVALRGLFLGKLPWPLFVHGPAGTGKTCAVLCALDYLYAVYSSADPPKPRTLPAGRYLVLPEVLRRLTDVATGDDKWIAADLVWRPWQLAQVGVLDELGAREKVSDFHYETVKRLLDERAGQPIIVASNHNLAGIEQVYDDRIASRCAAGTVVALTGTDRRLTRS